MKSTTHDRFIVAAIIVIMAALLWILPARAQCDASCSAQPEPPISATSSSTLYLPALARNWHAWYTDSELDDAMTRAGYDVETASMHTNCYLDPSATPPHDIRYSSCEQYLIGDTPTEGTQHYIWYVRLGDGIVHGIEVGGTYAAGDGASEAPCYIDVDGMEACG